MVKYLSNFKVILALILVVAILLLVISACDIGRGQSVTSQPPQFGILTPAENTRTLVGSPVQIQSAFNNPGQISRVELWVKAPSKEREELLRSDVPAANGVVLQGWVPQEPGPHTIRLITYFKDSAQTAALVRQVEVLDKAGVLPTAVAGANGFTPPEATRVWATPTLIATATLITDLGGEEFQPPTATPNPTATPTPYFPPPPPAPGVPPGPTQAQLPKKIPPVCDAAEYLGVFTSGVTDQRIFIPTDDMVPAKVVAGSIVHRAWQLRNIGTCTWGPNYELAFYGGRAMGSGGVAFEAFYPPDSPRRNVVIDQNRLIVPQGKPNQIAVAEVLLNVPVIPGIHQSYWRMRNPQGVFFGPIVGVTLEVVRDCRPEPGGPIIYGAPLIRRFRILGVARDLAPPGAGETVPFRAEVGDPITLDWEVVNATNFDIIIRDPTGDISSISTSDPSDRAIFTPSRVGEYVLTLFVDNGSCSYDQQLLIDVRPPREDQFVLTMAFASNAPITTSDPEVAFSATVLPGTMEVDWDHFDNDVDEVILHADRYVRRRIEKCPFFDTIFGSKFHCYETWSDWTREPNTIELATNKASGQERVCDASISECRRLRTEITSAQDVTITAEQHQRLIFCQPSSDRVEYVVNYYLEAKKDGQAADPPVSNTVAVKCNSGGAAGGQPELELP